MTTTVTVTPAGHHVSVTERQVSEGEVGHNVTENTVTLEPGGAASTFYVHGQNTLVISELAEAPAPAPTETSGAAEKIGEDDQD